MSSDKDKNKPEGTENAPLDSMAAGAEEPATSPTSIVGHPSEEHESAPVETFNLDEPSTLDDGQDSPMLGFAALVLVFVAVLTVTVAKMTPKDGPLLLENRTLAIAANGAYIPTVAVATIASQVAVAAMSIPGMPHVPDSNAPPPPPVAPVAAPPPGNTDVATASATSSEPSWQAGEAIFRNPANACSTCHSTDGSRLVGPSLKDKYGTTEKLADGSTVTIDDAYIHESLINPTAKVVEGFPPAMPSQDGKFSDAQIQSIILWIRHLAGKDPTP